jgi:hypothetical protein
MTEMTFENAANLGTSATSSKDPSTKRLWAGVLISGLPALFLLADAAGKLAKPAQVVQATMQLGYPASCITGLGVVLLLCTILYLLPRTAPLGAILLTGYLGGAVATHVRVSAGWFNILFPIFFGCLLWIGLALRDERVAKLFQRDAR